MRRPALTLAIAVVAMGAAAGAARADLEVGIATPAAALTPFLPGHTATSSGVLTITSALADWTLKAADATAGSPAPGHLVRGGACTAGAAFLAQPLAITATPDAGQGASSGEQALGASAVTVATGPAGVATVTAAYRQPIGANELLQSGCSYAVTIAYTLS